MNAIKNNMQSKSINRVCSAAMIVGLFLLSVPTPTYAIIYDPGATLDPTCLPTETDCTVTPPITGVATTSTFQTPIEANDTIKLTATSTPSDTTARLYNVGNVLYWNGSTVGGTYYAGTGLSLASSTFSLDINSLAQTTAINASNTIAIYDGTGVKKIARSDFLQGITSALTYQGTWDANTNTPTVADGVGTAGYVYVASSASTTVNLGSGALTVNSGDFLIYNTASSKWEVAPSGSQVQTVFGRTGNIVSSNGDYNTDQITETATATNKFFTDTRARNSISSNVLALSYATSTGVLSLASGYDIPLTASTTEWSGFFNTPSSRITAGSGLSWIANTLSAIFASATTDGIVSTTTQTFAGNKTFTGTTALATTTATGLTLSQNGLTLASAIPSATSSTLYNNGGVLYFNGSAVGGEGATTTINGVTGPAFTFNVLQGLTISTSTGAITFASNYASTTADGIVSTTTQSIAGNKTFTGTTALATTTASMLTISGTTTLQGTTIAGSLLWNASYTTATMPDASTYHGMFAHNHDTASFYGSHAGNWLRLVHEDASNNTALGGNLTVASSTALATTTATGLVISQNGVILASSTPATTTLALYNLDNTLYWNGVEVGGSVALASTTAQGSVSTTTQSFAGDKTFTGTTTLATTTSTTLTADIFSVIGTSTLATTTATALSANTLSIFGTSTLATTSATSLSANALTITATTTLASTTVNGLLATAQGITIASSTPATTTMAIYNLGGTLYWNGTALGSGGTAFSNTAITDKATGGVIGAATTTVDIHTSFTVNQTTTGQALSLPDPTVTTAGKIVTVTNVGTASFTMYTTQLSVSSPSGSFIWNGSAWNPIGASANVASEYGQQVIPSQTGTFASYTDVTSGSFTLPSAGIWEVEYSVGAYCSGSGSAVFIRLADNSGTAVAESISNRNCGTVNNADELSNTVRITTTDSEVYKMQIQNGSGGGIASGHSNKITWKKISGNTAVAGQSVDYVNAIRSVSASVTNGTPITFQSSTGNIPFASNTTFTLRAGKTYRLQGSVVFNPGGSTNINTQWRDTTNNAYLGVGSVNPTGTTIFGAQPIAEAIVTPTTDITVQLWPYATGTFDTGWATITQLGSSALTSDSIVAIGGNTLGNTLTIGTLDSNALALTASSTEAMRILANGNIGIGTTTPSSRLFVQGAAGSTNIFTLASSTGASLLTMTSAGNLGIGTTTPSTKLHINSDTISILRISAGAGHIAGLQLDSDNGGMAWALIEDPDDGAFRIFEDNPVGLNGVARFTIASSTGNIGIGTTTPSSRLFVQGAAGSGDIFTLASSTGASLLTMTSAGNIGIGTSTPLHSLDIMNATAGGGLHLAGSDNPRAIIEGLTSAAGNSEINLLTRTAGGATQFAAMYNNQPDGSLRFYVNGFDRMTIASSTGNIGIGTTTPTGKLQLVGDGDASHTNNALYIESTAASGRTFAISSRGNGGQHFSIADETASSERFIIAANGDATFIGSGGTCTISGAGACASDASLKENVLNLGMSLDKLLEARAVTYDWIDPSLDQDTRTGFIAQEIEALFPEFVHEIQNFNSTGTIKGLDYAGLVVPTIKAVQELADYVGYSSTSKAFNIDTNGNIGIGTTIPSSVLHVHDSTGVGITVSSGHATEGGQVTFGGASGQNSYSIDNYNNADAQDFRVLQANTVRAYITNGVDGWQSPSDRRLKENIVTLDGVLDKLEFFGGVKYDRIDGASGQIGVIAQDLYKAFPEIVSGDPDNASTTLGVNYGALSAVAIQGVKELSWIASSTAATSTTAEDGTVTKTFVGRFFDRLVAWFADKANGIKTFFAGEVRTDKLCLTDSNGDYICLTADDIKDLGTKESGADSVDEGAADETDSEQTQTENIDDTPSATSTVTITINGESSADVTVGEIYIDEGAEAADTATTTPVAVRTYQLVNGELTEVSSVDIDTATTSTHQITYRVLAEDGTTVLAEATRTVNVVVEEMTTPEEIVVTDSEPTESEPVETAVEEVTEAIIETVEETVPVEEVEPEPEEKAEEPIEELTEEESVEEESIEEPSSA